MKSSTVAAAAAALAASLAFGNLQTAQAVSGEYAVQSTAVFGISVSEQAFMQSGCSPTVRTSALNGYDAAIIPLSGTDANKIITVSWSGVSKSDVIGGPITHAYTSACRQVIASSRVTSPTTMTVQLPGDGAWLVLGNNLMANITYRIS